jgi:hypothetical protein
MKASTNFVSVNNFHEWHNSNKEAKEAARRMSAEKAKFFSAEYSVEVSVVCDPECAICRTERIEGKLGTRRLAFC